MEPCSKIKCVFKLFIKIDGFKKQKAKAAVKDAKNRRRGEMLKVKAQKVPETPFEKYKKDPAAFEKSVEDAQKNACLCWDRLIVEYGILVQSMVVNLSLTLCEINEGFQLINTLKKLLNDASSAKDLADTLGRNALNFRTQLESQSEEAQGPAPENAEARVFVPEHAEARVFVPEHARLIQSFIESEQARLALCQKEAIAVDKQKVPNDFIDCLSQMFPQSNKIYRMILCAFIKILVSGITFSEPTCETTIRVLTHYHTKAMRNRNRTTQSEKIHEVDGSIVVSAKHCAEGDKKCLDCAGVQALNVVHHHYGYMTDAAIKKMLVSLLNGHKTALEALSEYLVINCNYKFEPRRDSSENYQLQQNRAQRYDDLIMIFNYQFCRRCHFSEIEQFSQEQHGEIVRLLLEHLGMTIEQVDSHITAFLSTPE